MAPLLQPHPSLPLTRPPARLPALPPCLATAGALQTYEQDAEPGTLEERLAAVTFPPGWGPIENVTVTPEDEVHRPWQSGGTVFWFSECSG